MVYVTRGSQLLLNHRNKSTGSNSLYGFAMQGIGPVIRILTTIQEIGFDFVLLVGYGNGVLLNGALVAQYFLYYGEKATGKEAGGEEEPDEGTEAGEKAVVAKKANKATPAKSTKKATPRALGKSQAKPAKTPRAKSPAKPAKTPRARSKSPAKPSPSVTRSSRKVKRA